VLAETPSSTSGYLGAGDEALFVTTDRADGRVGLVLCPPLFQEEQFSRPVLAALGRDLAAAGVDVARFDYAGTGDSAGRPDRVGLDGLVESALRCHAWLGERVAGPVGMLGIRLGAAVARLAASRSPDVAFLALVDPVLKLATHADQLLRAKVTQQTVQTGQVTLNRQRMREILAEGDSLEIYGYRLSPDLYHDLVECGDLDPTAERPCPTLWIEMSERARGGAGEGARERAEGAAASDEATCFHESDDPPYRSAVIHDEPIWRDPRIWSPRRAALLEVVTGWVLSFRIE